MPEPVFDFEHPLSLLIYALSFSTRLLAQSAALAMPQLALRGLHTALRFRRGLRVRC